MEAKDTVMSIKELAKAGGAHDDVPDMEWQWVADKQAEISFKAGYKKARQDLTLHLEAVAELCREHRKGGVKEVVEDLAEVFDKSERDHTISAIWNCIEKWQAQLKEWGIK